MSDLYDDWIRYTFDRPELSNPWESDLGAVPFEAESIPAVMSELVVQTCLLSGEELTRFSDLQVATGLRYIFEPSCSDVVFTLMHPSLALDARVACIDSIFHLYEGCFQKRCPANSGP